MQVFKSTEVAKRLRAIQQIVQTEAVLVESRGQVQLVMLSLPEYERLRRQDRRAHSTAELSSGQRAAILAAKPSVDAAQFNNEAAK